MMEPGQAASRSVCGGPGLPCGELGKCLPLAGLCAGSLSLFLGQEAAPVSRWMESPQPSREVGGTLSMV